MQLSEIYWKLKGLWHYKYVHQDGVEAADFP